MHTAYSPPISYPVGKPRSDADDVVSLQSSLNGRFPCDMCPQSFRLGSLVRRHMATVHKLGKQLHCPLCTYHKTVRKDSLRKHLRRIHPGATETFGGCPVCSLMVDNVLEHVINGHAMMKEDVVNDHVVDSFLGSSSEPFHQDLEQSNCNYSL